MAEVEQGCAMCGEDLDRYRTPLVVTFEDDDDARLSREFCCWQHIADWVASHDYPFPLEPTVETWKGRAGTIGCLAFLVVNVVLWLAGIVSVLGRLGINP